MTWHVIRDSGDYHCVAKNDHPPIIVKTIRLNVMCKSGVLITKRELMRLFQVGPEVRAVRAELLVEVGRTARLGCEVRGYPAPGTGWYKDDRGDYLDLQHWLIKLIKYTCQWWTSLYFKSWSPARNTWWTALGQTQIQLARWKPFLTLERYEEHQFRLLLLFLAITFILRWATPTGECTSARLRTAWGWGRQSWCWKVSLSIEV